MQALLDWRNTAEDLNRRLDITEIRLCTADAIERDELALLRDIARRPDGPFARAGRRLDDLSAAATRSPRRPGGAAGC